MCYNKIMNIRKMKIEDFEQVKNLQKQVYKLHIKNRPDIYFKTQSFFNFEYFLEQLNDENTLNFVCHDGETIAGIILASYKKPSKVPIIKKRKVIFIDSVVVDKHYQRCGVATKMFNYLISFAEKENVESIELNVWDFNEKAKKFYEHIGMTQKNITYEMKIKG